MKSKHPGYAFRHEEPARAGELYLYVIEIRGQCVKIGVTKNIDSRMRSHRSAAEAHGRVLGRAWFSGPHANARANESRLKGSSPREYLRHANFDVVARRAWSLPFLRAEELAI